MPDPSMPERQRIVVPTSGDAAQLRRQAQELRARDEVVARTEFERQKKEREAEQIGERVGRAVKESLAPVLEAGVVAEGVETVSKLAESVKPSPKTEEPAPKKDHSRLTVAQLQRDILRAKLDSEDLGDLRAEKQSRVDILAEEYNKKTGGNLSTSIENRIKEALGAATPAYYQAVLEKVQKEKHSPFGDSERDELYNVVTVDEFDRVLQKIYLGAEKSEDPPVNKADPETIRTKTERVEKSRVESGVHIDNPIDLLGTLPPTFADWQRTYPGFAAETEIKDSVANYYQKLEEQQKIREAMVKMGQGPEGYSASPPPAEFVAIFRQGRYGTYEKMWKDKVKFLDVLNAKDRLAWCFLNMGAFTNGIIPSPEQNWKAIIDTWSRDLDDSAFLAKASTEQLKEIKSTKELLRSMMAVSASARAMEQSGGAASKYVATLTVSRDGDLDKQDSWAEFLLHKDSEKYRRVVSSPLVKTYYDRLLKDAGVTVQPGKDSGQGDNKVSIIEVNKEVALKGKLLEYLVKGKDYKGGFDAYVKEILLPGDNDFSHWAAAKLACDAFLVDKFTRWEYEITGGKNPKPEDELMIMPFAGWGGDPLRAILQPSFLPRVIKGVYSDEDKAIMDMTDAAFRPDDIFAKLGNIEPIPVSMVGHLKDYARYNDALWKFVGGSRAPAIPAWTSKIMNEELPAIAELLDQVYGGKGEKDYPDTGKHLVGAMMARILETKALATTAESSRPGFKDNMKILFNVGDPKEARPFLEVEKFLWGPDLDAKRGFLASLVGSRTRLVLNRNYFGAEERLKNVWELLYTNDQDPKGRGKATLLNRVGFILDITNVIAKLTGKVK